ncbi:MAG TPA: SGNH/GDSL hydrolase family protein, partial [Caulobacteraceae bacterium]
MGHINLFAKGNVDVHDSLHSCRVGGEVRWNGVNEVMRARCPGALIRLRHETSGGTEALLAADGAPPEEIIARDDLLGPHPARSQFSAALFESAADAVILSILPDVFTELVRHRRKGFLFFPYGRETWPAVDRQWLASDFEAIGKLDAARSMANFEGILERLRRTSQAPLLIYNLSPVIPGEWIHCFEGLADGLSTRMRQFNLALIDLSARTGVSIVDVEGIVAAAGAQRMKLDALHLTPDGYALVAEAVVRILDDLG